MVTTNRHGLTFRNFQSSPAPLREHLCNPCKQLRETEITTARRLTGPDVYEGPTFAVSNKMNAEVFALQLVPCMSLLHLARSLQFRNKLITHWKYINNQYMHLNIYYVFHSQFAHQHVSTGIPAFFRVMLLLQEYKCTNLVKCVTITRLQLKW